jgi:hypothetical protein
MLFEFIRFVAPIISIRWRFSLTRNIRPNIREFAVHLKKILGFFIRVGPYGLSWAFRLTYPTIDTFVGVNDKHIFPFIKAIHGTYFNAIHKLTLYARITDYVRHTVLRILLSGNLPILFNPLLKSRSFFLPI